MTNLFGWFILRRVLSFHQMVGIVGVLHLAQYLLFSRLLPKLSFSSKRLKLFFCVPEIPVINGVIMKGHSWSYNYQAIIAAISDLECLLLWVVCSEAKQTKIYIILRLFLTFYERNKQKTSLFGQHLTSTQILELCLRYYIFFIYSVPLVANSWVTIHCNSNLSFRSQVLSTYSTNWLQTMTTTSHETDWEVFHQKHWLRENTNIWKEGL